MVKPSKKRRPRNPPAYGLVQDNPMFPQEQTCLIRSVRFKAPVPCALCGKKRKLHWTMLVPFHAVDFDALHTFQEIDRESGPLLAPLAPVCPKHLLAEDAAVMPEMFRTLRYFYSLTVDRLAREAKASK